VVPTCSDSPSRRAVSETLGDRRGEPTKATTRSIANNAGDPSNVRCAVATHRAEGLAVAPRLPGQRAITEIEHPSPGREPLHDGQCHPRGCSHQSLAGAVGRFIDIGHQDRRHIGVPVLLEDGPAPDQPVGQAQLAFHRLGGGSIARLEAPGGVIGQGWSDATGEHPDPIALGRPTRPATLPSAGATRLILLLVSHRQLPSEGT
jgi:hypothetical protein